MISHIDIKRLTMEEYSDLIQQHHDFIKTGDISRSRSNIPKQKDYQVYKSYQRINSKKTGDPERRFTLDQSQIIKCNLEDKHNISGYQDSAFLDKM